MFAASEFRRGAGAYGQPTVATYDSLRAALDDDWLDLPESRQAIRDRL